MLTPCTQRSLRSQVQTRSCGDPDSTGPPPQPVRTSLAPITWVQVPALVIADEESLVRTRTGRRFERLEDIRSRALDRAGQIADQLYATAPQDAPGPTRSVYGRNVRGSWATANLIAPSRLRFFLGLLDEPLTPEQAGAPRRKRNTATQRDAESIQIAVTGRIFVVVARDAAQDPEWSEVTSRIE